MDFSIDIMIGKEKVGSVIGGQVLPSEPDEEEFRKKPLNLELTLMLISEHSAKFL